MNPHKDATKIAVMHVRSWLKDMVAWEKSAMIDSPLSNEHLDYIGKNVICICCCRKMKKIREHEWSCDCNPNCVLCIGGEVK